MNFLYFKRRVWNACYFLMATIALVIGVVCLLWMLIDMIRNGLPALSWHVFTTNTLPPTNHGGLKNALFGSGMIIFYALLIGVPIGFLIGIYLAEFGKNKPIANVIRFVNDILLSIPSILLGLFIYQLIVIRTQHFSGWAGSLALALLVVPIIVRTTENMFSLVPNWLRESGFALGAAHWRVIISVVLRVARTGVLTGILLAIARISGETAPLLFTALNNQFWSTDMSHPMANLPSVIFQYATSPYLDWQQLAWTGALLITSGVLGLNILIRVLFKQKPPLT